MIRPYVNFEAVTVTKDIDGCWESVTVKAWLNPHGVLVVYLVAASGRFTNILLKAFLKLLRLCSYRQSITMNP